MEKSFLNWRMLDALQNNHKKLSNTKLAALERLPVTTFFRRLKILKENGIISFQPRLDREGIGLKAMAFVLVILEQHGRAAFDAFQAWTEANEEIVECWKIKGRDDCILRVVADTKDKLDGFIELMDDTPLIQHHMTFEVTARLKETHKLPLYHLGKPRP